MKKLPLTCPCCKKESLKKLEKSYICLNNECMHNNEKDGFPIIKSIPIMICEIHTDTVCTKNSFETYVDRPLSKYKDIKKIIMGESKITKKNCKNFIKNLFLISKKPKVLVIGGGDRGSGTDKLWSNKEIEIHSVDIYASNNVDAVCDGHYLCFKNNYYDGVWIQAVLEHVVEPNVVVNEIFRVLKTNGLVYAETPFMQQVHEGAYDFTRFTVLGHRYLFKKFKLIELGGNEGPEIVFAWSIRYLIWSLFRNKNLAKIIGIISRILIRPLGYLTSKKSMYDSSSGVFFLGRKIYNHNLSHKKLIGLYKGQF